MKKLVIMFTLFLGLSSSASANEVKCRTFDVACKMKKFANDTKNYQKKEWIKGGKDQIDQLKKLRPKK